MTDIECLGSIYLEPIIKKDKPIFWLTFIEGGWIKFVEKAW